MLGILKEIKKKKTHELQVFIEPNKCFLAFIMCPDYPNASRMAYVAR